MGYTLARMAGNNALYYGDNLAVLRDSIASDSVDLVYLDPPFNSNASYNVLFAAPSGERSAAQIEAFEDTWHWNEAAALAFDEAVRGAHSDASIMLRAMRQALGENDMMAYLAMMAVRLIELHRVMKPTGSLYLHCDPTASHYLKVLLDAIFGPAMFRNEIIWRRTTGKSLMTIKLPSNHDTILSYQKSEAAYWNVAEAFVPYDHENLPAKTAEKYSHVDETGRRYQLDNLINPNPNRPNLTYEFLGITRVWRWTKDRMEKAYLDGLVIQPNPRSVPRLKRYLDEQRGVALGDVWTDIPPLNSQAQERLGYPTQKPLALLERILRVASKEGDFVLDPFCGCGTTVHAAQKLRRQWIGIDVTHLAIGLIERRMRDAFPGASFEVHGVPKDSAGARNLAERDKHEFQKWIVGSIGGQPYKGGQKGMDRGVDGYLHFRDADKKPQFAVISVKGGGTKSGDVRDLKGTMERTDAVMGLFLTLNDPSREMVREANASGFYETGGMSFSRIQIMTAADILAGKTPRVPFGFSEGYRAAPAEKTRGQEELF